MGWDYPILRGALLPSTIRWLKMRSFKDRKCLVYLQNIHFIHLHLHCSPLKSYFVVFLSFWKLFFRIRNMNCMYACSSMDLNSKIRLAVMLRIATSARVARKQSFHKISRRLRRVCFFMKAFSMYHSKTLWGSWK